MTYRGHYLEMLPSKRARTRGKSSVEESAASTKRSCLGMGLQGISSAELIQQIGLLIPTLKDIVCGKVTENNCSWLDVNKIFCRYALSGMICFPVVQLESVVSFSSHCLWTE